MVEEGPFLHDPAVVGLLIEHFVEARIHTDAVTAYAEEVVPGLQDRFADGNRAQPIYVVLEPGSERTVARLFGAKLGEIESFLRGAIVGRR